MYIALWCGKCVEGATYEAFGYEGMKESELSEHTQGISCRDNLKRLHCRSSRGEDGAHSYVHNGALRQYMVVETKERRVRGLYPIHQETSQAS
jgi:hypothetical protein